MEQIDGWQNGAEMRPEALNASKQIEYTGGKLEMTPVQCKSTYRAMVY